MADQAALLAWREKLLAMRFGAVRRVRDAGGDDVTFSSDAELARAIEAADRELAAGDGRTPIRTIHFHTNRKGLF